MSIASTGNRNEGERQAMEVAEEAREEQWTHPSFCAELFNGTFNFDLIFPFPVQSPEEKRIGDELVAKVTEFLVNNHDPELTEKTKEIPPKTFEGLRKLGLFGMKIPKEYGGLGLTQTNFNRVMGAVATHCGSVVTLLSAHQSIGAPQPLKLFGTKEQKEKFLPRLARGEISAFALTEVGVGSDPARMQTTAVPSADGKHWIINGEKLWCTNGPIADILVVMASTPPKKLPNGREKKQITAFLVEKTMPGFEVVHRCDFLGLKAIYNGLLRFTNVKVPAENIIWGEGKGLKLALITLNTGRLTIPAVCSASTRACTQIGRHWANERVQWGARIGEHEAAATALVLSAGAAYANDAVSMLSSGLADSAKADLRIEASLSKLFTTGLNWRVIDNVFQLRGGRGFETAESLRARGEDAYPLERMLRDHRINTIVEGTSAIQRLFVSREALDKHLRIAGVLFNPQIGVVGKLGLVIKATFFYMFWYPRLWIPTLWPRYSSFGCWEGKYLRLVANSSKRLARKTFHAMILNGPRLERKQNTLGRIVDAGTDLFVLAAVLSRYLTQKRMGQVEKHEDVLVKTVCRHLAREIRGSFKSIRSASSPMYVRLSKALMAGELAWLESDIINQAELAKRRKS